MLVALYGVRAVPASGLVGLGQFLGASHHIPFSEAYRFPPSKAALTVSTSAMFEMGTGDAHTP